MRIIIALLIACSVGLALAKPAHAAEYAPSDWYFVGESGKTKVYVRFGDLLMGRADSTAARAWVRYDDRKDPKAKYAEAKILYHFNCIAQTYRIISGTLYKMDGSSSTVPGDGKADLIVPDSNGEAIANLLCTDNLPADVDMPTPAEAPRPGYTA